MYRTTRQQSPPQSSSSYNVLYDGTSSNGFGTPPFKARDILSVPLTTASKPSEVQDMVLGKIMNGISSSVSNTIVQYIIGIVAALVYLITIILLTLAIFTQIKVPGVIANTKVWDFIRKVPLGVWTILAAIASGLMKFLIVMENLSNMANLLLGTLLIVYVIKTWSTCPRYLLLITALYILVVALMRLNVMGITQVTSMAEMFIQWNFLVCALLTIIDMFIVVPQCKKSQ